MLFTESQKEIVLLIALKNGFIIVTLVKIHLKLKSVNYVQARKGYLFV